MYLIIGIASVGFLLFVYSLCKAAAKPTPKPDGGLRDYYKRDKIYKE